MCLSRNIYNVYVNVHVHVQCIYFFMLSLDYIVLNNAPFNQLVMMRRLSPFSFDHKIKYDFEIIYMVLIFYIN